MKKQTEGERALSERLALAVRFDEGEPLASSNKSPACTRASINSRIEEYEAKFRFPARSLLAAWTSTLGLSTDEVFTILGRHRAVAAFTWSKWALTALRLFQQGSIEAGVDTCGERFQLCSAAWPWLRTARKRFESILLTKFSSSPKGFNRANAVKIFYPFLLEECQRIMLRTIALELNVARLRDRLLVGTSAERFEYFCRDLAKLDNALPFWCEYPVLLRFVVEACFRWIEQSVELLERLDGDWDTMVTAGLIGSNSSILAEVLPVGDPHCDGRRVSILRFSNGSHIVYKPRSVAADDAFRVWLGWLRAWGLEPHLEAPKLFDRGQYAWVEFIEHVASPEVGPRARFYFRCGAALAVADALGIKDLNQENIIAKGEVPYFVDVECVISPVLRTIANESARLESLLGVGLLPGFPVGNIETGGLAPSGNDGAEVLMPTVTNWATDLLRVESLPAKLPTMQNTPGEIHTSDLSRYAEDVVQGFKSAYSLIVKNRINFFDAVRDLAVRSTRIRYIPRGSHAYGIVRDSLLHPNILRDAYDGEALIGKLVLCSSRALLPLLPSERKQLWQLDIPVFWVTPGSRCLWTASGQRVRGLFEHSGASRVHHQIRKALKTGYIDYCARTVRAAMLQPTPQDVFNSFPAPTGHVPNDCLKLADAIGRHVLLKAWRSDRGKLEWIDRAEDVATHVAGGQTVGPMNEELYSGLAGMLIFYAYLSQLTSEHVFEEVVDKLSIQIEAAVRNTCRAALNGVWGDRIRRTGGFVGITSAIYALLHVSHLRGDPTTARSAHLLVDALCEWPARDSTLDWIAGAAGAIPVLVAMHRLLPSIGALEIARACGNRLVTTARRVGIGCAWVTLDKVALTGLGHGASGIALGLHRLASALTEDGLAQTINGALHFERDNYSPEAANWFDLRTFIPSSERLCAYGWCSGAAGIGLARIAMSPLRSVTYSDDIGSAFAATKSHVRELPSDCLCHGRFGNLEFLFSTAWHSGNADQREAALTCLADVLESVRSNGFRFLCGGETLSFMLGLAGIGYTLLRVATEGVLPSVLLLEEPVGVSGRGCWSYPPHGRNRE